ncbi:helical backbone metal receptor [Oligoflexia bacterium]|nr:helical backbone metal receptor [Oligoflexia bacterium]
MKKKSDNHQNALLEEGCVSPWEPLAKKAIPSAYKSPLHVFILLLICNTLLSINPAMAVDKTLSHSVSAPLCRRIISLSPSITEVLYALDLGQDLVGVTRYDRYPSDVDLKQKIGGFLDPNYEAIVALQPTVIFLLSEHIDSSKKLKKLGLNIVTLDHRNISGILDSILKVGKLCHRKSTATALKNRLQGQGQAIKRRIAGKAPVKTLVVIGGGAAEGALKNVYISGQDGFYSELLTYAGGENVYKDKTISMPTVSLEGLGELDPDVIIEVVYPGVLSFNEEKRVLEGWSKLSHLDAVKNKRVYLLKDDFISIPGPRYVEALKRFVGILHGNLK